jgi:raffinose/stachyose/melibiose transport system permease protein
MAVDISLKKLKNYYPIYLLVALPLALVILFNYYPIVNGFIHIFYRWDGDLIEEYVGFKNIMKMMQDGRLWHSFLVVGIFVLSNLVKMIIPILAAVTLHHIISDRAGYAYRIMVIIPMIVPSMVFFLLWKYFYEPNAGVLNEVLRAMNIIDDTAIIQWLSSEYLLIPSLVFAGFPWIGAFGVLIYLAGLQNIPEDIYEAADIDGAGTIKIFWGIELPLIMTQIRINLILMMIGTVQQWQNVYLFVGEGGGPNGIATVPGLLVFREAFSRGFFGYGCAVGFMLFLVTLLLTFLNNKFVRIEK